MESLFCQFRKGTGFSICSGSSLRRRLHVIPTIRFGVKEFNESLGGMHVDGYVSFEIR